MPCHDERDLEADAAAGQAAVALQKRLDERTDMLCRVCRNLELGQKGDLARFLPPDVADWWRRHKELDRQREASK